MDVHFKNFPGLEEVSGWHGDTLDGGSLDRSASARNHVISNVALECCLVVPPLHKLISPSYSGMIIGGMDKC